MEFGSAYELVDEEPADAWADSAWQHDELESGGPWLRQHARALVLAAFLTVVVLAGAVLVGLSRGDSAQSTASSAGGQSPAAASQSASPMTSAPSNGPVLGSASTTAEPTGSSAAGNARSSGWAPKDATVLPEQRYRHLDGKVDGINPDLLRRIDAVGAGLGRDVTIISGWRRHHEQVALYAMYLNGTGNLAAVPGTSHHETGNAADAYIDGVALNSVPGVSALASKQGLYFPVNGEAWHVEVNRAS